MEAVRRTVDQAFAAGRVDVVVSNAGYGLTGAAEEVTDDQIRAQVDTNLLGSIQLIRTAIPHLRRQGGGRIVQISSEGGQISYPNFSLYHATKWGIEGFVEAVAQEVATFGMEFTLVEPSATKTDFATRSLAAGTPMSVYDDTPIGAVRRALSGAETKWEFDDPQWMVRATIASVDETPAPRRLPMHFAGSFMVENYAVPASVVRRYMRERPWQGRPSLAGVPSTGADGTGIDVPPRHPGHPTSLGEAMASLRRAHPHADIVAMRAGYLLRSGRLSDERYIAVSVRPTGAEAVRSGLPSIWEGWPVSVRVASLQDRSHPPRAPAATEEVVATTSYDDDARGDGRFSLDVIDEVMTIDCHVGPERGWATLDAFLRGTSDDLVCGMYEFHAAHVADSVEAVLSRGASVTIVMSPHSRDRRSGLPHAGDFRRGDTFGRWRAVHAPRFSCVFVPMGAGGLVANAYHVKVAVRDSSACWLSSGNWKRTSQPVVAPEDRGRPRTLARLGNREWHLVVENATLSGRLREHVLADLRRSEALGGMPEAVDADDGFAVIENHEDDDAIAEAAPREVIEPMRITKRLRVTPLLTPDRRGKALREAILDLIASAGSRICLQQQYISLVAEPDGDLNAIVEALVGAARMRDVRILLRAGGGGLRENLEALQAKGLEVRRCVRVLSSTHVKGIIADGSRIITGSHNWSEAALTLNRDASLLIEDPEVAGYFEQVFDMDWDRAREPSFAMELV